MSPKNNKSSSWPTNKILTCDSYRIKKSSQRAQKHGVKNSWQLHQCEASREPLLVMHCFKCQKIGHSARECSNAIRCLCCSQDHGVRKCTVAKENVKCSNCGGAHATVYRSCSPHQHNLPEVSKKINENKLKPQTNTELTASTEKISVLLIEVLRKIRTVVNTMSYSDIKKFRL